MIIKPQLFTVEIIYYRLDYTSLLQEFLWQTYDITPSYPRINKFLKFWHTDIRATINSITVMENTDNGWKKVDFEIK